MFSQLKIAILGGLVLIVLNMVVVRCEDTIFKIRKCCAEDEVILERTGLCSEYKLLKVKDHGYYINDTTHGGVIAGGDRDSWPWWFPPQAEILAKRDNKTLKTFPKKYELIAGQGQPCDRMETSHLPAYFYKYKFYDDGSILVYPNSEKDYHVLDREIAFDPLSFCIDRLELEDDTSKDEGMEPVLDFSETVDYLVLLCPCKRATCIRKCCQSGMLFDLRNGNEDTDSCIRNDGDDWIPVYSKDAANPLDYYILHDMPDCKPEESIVMPNYPISDESGYVIFSNGSARINGETYVSRPLGFCGDKIIDSKDMKVHNRILRCFPKFGIENQWSVIKRTLYGWVSVVGAVFLFLTLVVDSCLPTMKKTNDKSLIFQTWSLFAGYVCVAISQLGARSLPQGVCTCLGFMIQYCFLSAFFWLNVLCFDISYTFSSFRIARGHRMQYTRKKQLFYFSYGWISPGLIVLLTVIVEYYPGVSDYLLKPEISERCWFKKGSLAQLAYFYGPIATLLAINLFLFLYTSFKIMRARNDISTTIRSRNMENQRFLLYLKLFILMGLSWITELISWAVGGPEYYWFIPDTVNLLRAVFIFVIFCCKKQVVEELTKKFGLKKEGNVRRPSNTRSSSALGTYQFGESHKSSYNNADSSL